ncbi:PREDICTED: cytosolic 5'-nucleotidase 1A-like [Nanorana parkeri]|uniref:cytosolic 5'-nucleotidase 1A-like n=1 Tax=Nanorana parkeri TaxID=125878 RepID=UPI0008540F88|nr:PREDICTED: cytosolic 5'-nucleotidase 1A-like [Nanorana parkeri]
MSTAKDNPAPDTTQPSPKTETLGQHSSSEAKAFYDSIAPKKKPKLPKPQNAITIAVSSRVLFNMVEERKMYQDDGVEKYVLYQQEHEEEPLKPGPAFAFVKAVEEVNRHLRGLYPESEEIFDIVLMTNNHAQVGVRLINSINHYDLNIERFCMTGGKSPIGYLKAYLTNLYLSSDSEKVQEAIEAGIAAATMFTPKRDIELPEKELRVAFDGDAVLFSDESEQIVKERGLDSFFEHEKKYEDKPLAQGPLKCFLEALGRLQRKFYAKDERLTCPIRTYLVTARSAASSGARVLKTLRSWGLEIDEALFLAGAPKGPILDKIRPHLFFDDQMFHIEGAHELGTIAAHVPYGIGQKYHKSTPKEEPKKEEAKKEEAKKEEAKKEEAKKEEPKKEAGKK